MTKTALDLSTEIDDISELRKKLENALETAVLDSSIDATIRVTDVRKLINILNGQIDARINILNNIKVNVDQVIIGETE